MLASTSSLAATASVTTVATSALTSTSILTAIADVTVEAAVALASISTLLVSANPVVFGTSALSSTSSLTAAGTTAIAGIADLSSASSLSGTAAVTAIASGSLTSASILSATPSITVQAACALSSTSSLSGAGTLTRLGTSALSATSTLTAAGTVIRLGTGSLSAASTLSATGSVASPGVVTGVTAIVTLDANAGTANVDASTGGGTDGTVGPGSGVSVVGDVATATVTANAGTADVVNLPPVMGETAEVYLDAPSEDDPEVLDIDRSTDVITLTLEVSDCPHQPGTLVGSVSNGRESGIGYLFIDDSGTAFFEVGLDESGNATNVYIPVDSLIAGSHTMRAGSDNSIPESEAVPFTVGEELNGSGGISFSYPPDFITPGRWGLTAYSYYDIDNVPYYEFSINPDQVSYTYPENLLTTKHTTAHSGRMLTWEGVPRPGSISFGGHMLTRQDVEDLFSWVHTNQRVWLKDDLQNLYLVKLENCRATRKRDVERQWLHRYTITGTVLYGQGI